MNKYNISGISGAKFAHAMLVVAWKKSKVIGMGVLQDRGPDVPVDHILKGAGVDIEAEEGFVSADYVFGRMMKLHFKYDKNTVSHSGNQWTADYQSFCTAYPDFDALLAATIDFLQTERPDSEHPVIAELAT
jgi:hypothetical protein